MRRSTRLGLAVAILVLVAAFGGYTAFWFIAAGRVEQGVAQWAQSLRAQHIELSWRAIAVRGFPLAFRIDLSEPQLRAPMTALRAELQMPRLSATARPWSLRHWRFDAPAGLKATAEPAGRAGAVLTARAATGGVAVGADGGITARLRLADPSADAGVRVAALEADLRVSVPPHPPLNDTGRALGIALDVRRLTVPAAPRPFVNPVDDVTVSATVLGALRGGSPRQAAEAWRESGGTVELDHFALRWGTLAINGSGTLALDADLQPIGGFSGAIEGYEELMAALVAAGRVRAGDARLARLALALLTKAGPDGRPEIATSFTIQNGEMYLGPAKLGPAPRIDWQ